MMTSLQEDLVMENLRTIVDPELGINIVELGLVYGVSIAQGPGVVRVSMTLTAPGCGMGPVLVSDVKYRVARVPNVREVDVDLVFDPPWSRERMSDEARLATGMFF